MVLVIAKVTNYKRRIEIICAQSRNNSNNRFLLLCPVCVTFESK